MTKQFNISRFELGWPGRGFGNALMLAHLTKILVDNGIDAVFMDHRKTRGLVDVPLASGAPGKWVRFNGVLPSDFDVKRADEPGLLTYIRWFRLMTGKQIVFDRAKHNHIPVFFEDMDVPEVDVAMWTRTGPFGPYRDWPFFEDLKKVFDSEGITYLDMTQMQIMGIECLNVVKKAKMYLGLDTGTSHYVSKYANGKGLIIQGGFNPFFYWAWPYDYVPILKSTDCPLRPCFINVRHIAEGKAKCPKEVPCIAEISVERVFNEVREMLDVQKD
jgi:hypothetical protein